eukprot:1709199-Rhodomonas_salina.1
MPVTRREVAPRVKFDGVIGSRVLPLLAQTQAEVAPITSVAPADQHLWLAPAFLKLMNIIRR